MLNLSIAPFKNKYKPDSKRAGFISNNIAKHVNFYDYNQIESAIKTGCAWSSVFTDCKRCLDTWYGQQLFAADIDDGNISSIEQALQICEMHCIEPYIIHESFSSKPGQLKLRIIFKTEALIQDYGTALGIQRKLANIFDGDPAVCDVSRLYYGTNKGIAYSDTKAWLDIEELGQLENINKPGQSYIRNDIMPDDEAQLLQKSYLTDLAKNNPGRFNLLCTVFEEQKQNVQQLGQGSGYQSVFKAAMRLGRFNELLTQVIKCTITNWIADCDTYNNWQHADKQDEIIEAGILYGRKHLY